MPVLLCCNTAENHPEPTKRAAHEHSSEMAVLLETSRGDIVIDLFVEDCPLACRNFLKLCKCAESSSQQRGGSGMTACWGWSCSVQHRRASRGAATHRAHTGLRRYAATPDRPRRIKYYNNCLFHNVQRNFIVQTGDPTGTGKGGSSVYGCAGEGGHAAAALQAVRGARTRARGLPTPVRRPQHDVRGAGALL